MVHARTKSLNKQDIQKECVPAFPVLLALKKLPSYVLVVFIDINASYILTYRRKEFQNIIEKKLCNCFGSCYLFTEKMLNMELSMNDIGSAYGVCIHYTFLNFIADLMNTLQFNQMMNLTIC